MINPILNDHFLPTVICVVIYVVIGIFASQTQDTVERGFAFVFFWPIVGLVLAIRGLIDIIVEVCTD